MALNNATIRVYFTNREDVVVYGVYAFSEVDVTWSRGNYRNKFPPHSLRNGVGEGTGTVAVSTAVSIVGGDVAIPATHTPADTTDDLVILDDVMMGVPHRTKTEEVKLLQFLDNSGTPKVIAQFATNYLIGWSFVENVTT